jgi:thymidylate synthase ThyX
LLPHALETRMTMTGNLRAWRFFLEERSSPFAEPEIRRLSAHIMKAIFEYAPFVFQDMVDNVESIDGFPYYKPEVPKV